MPFIPTTDIITTSLSAISNANVSNGDYILIRPDIDIISGNSEAIYITHANMTVQVDGYVFGGASGVDLDAVVNTGFNYNLNIGQTG